jgi:Fe-S-cluster containining protein
MINPCLNCDACCASYRVSFYWGEPGASQRPKALTQQLNPWLN